MIHSIEPSSFYGANRATLDLVRNIRLSRLTSDVDSKTLTSNEKAKRSRSSSENGLRVPKPKIKMIKLFPGIKHGVKKAKPKVPVKEKKVSVEKRSSIRQIMKEKFDFSRTYYALPKKKPRIALNEETGAKRKFFKSTVPVEEPKKNEPPPTVDFEDINDVEEEPFANIKKDVSNIIHHIDWSDDEDYLKPQLTRKKAVALSNESYNISYLTPTLPVLTPVTPSTPSRKPNNRMNENIENTPKTYVELTNCSIPVTTPSPSKTTPTATDENTPLTETPKYYPIFTSPTVSNVLSDVTNNQPKCKVRLIKAASPNDQYQIDAGQKVIGPTECRKCGMVYDIGDPVDEQRHRKYHSNIEELKYKVSKTDNIVGYNGTDIIILIQYSDSKSKLDKLYSILKYTEDEIGTGYSFGPNWKAFVYIRQGSVLGCLIAEPKLKAHRIIHSDGITLLSEDSYDVKCGVNRIWVKPEFRGQKIASTMMNTLRKNFAYGEYLNLYNVAFSVTTAEGNEFAKKYTGRDDYLTYSS